MLACSLAFTVRHIEAGAGKFLFFVLLFNLARKILKVLIFKNVLLVNFVSDKGPSIYDVMALEGGGIKDFVTKSMTMRGVGDKNYQQLRDVIYGRTPNR